VIERRSSCYAPCVSNPPTIHRLEVRLDEVKPAVWRRLVVPSAARLDELHAVLQVAMGWTDSHLHMFEADGGRWESVVDGEERTGEDERSATLAQVAPAPNCRLRYEYDFGDGWSHTIVVESIEPAPTGGARARCLDGRRACPPEDSGGPWGYADKLEALADPRHPDHEGTAEWMGKGFDPEHFDCRATDARIGKIRLGRRPLQSSVRSAPAARGAMSDDAIIAKGIEALVQQLGVDGPEAFFAAVNRSAARLAVRPRPAPPSKQRSSRTKRPR